MALVTSLPQQHYIATTIDGPTFPITRCLGRGFNGVVFEVMTSDGACAMKVNNPETYPADTAWREADLLLSVQKVRHVLRYLGRFVLTEIHYNGPDFQIDYTATKPLRVGILTKLLPAKDTFDMYILPFAEGSRLSLEQIKELCKQMCEALNDLHEQGYYHGDVKPENTCFARKLKLLDFGHARHVRDSMPDRPPGTLEYNSPECVLSTKYNQSIDLWSLGATLFEYYTGYPLIPTEQELDDSQRIVDHMHLLRINMGGLPNDEIEASPWKDRLFSKKPDGTYGLSASPSDVARRIGHSHLVQLDRFGGMPVWQARIHYGALRRKDSPEDAKRLIALIEPMLRYKNRITAAEVLRRLESSEETLETKV